MSTVAELVAKLIAAGTPPELAAVVVTEAFSAGASCGKSGGIPVDEAAERRRAYDRERKREKRNSGGSPVEIPRKSETLSSSSLSTDSEKIEKKEIGARKTGRTIPPDWQPSEVHFLEGGKLGVDRQSVDRMGEDMRVWAQANANRAVARKADWNLTFTGWMRREAPKHGGQNGQRRTGGARQSGGDAFLAGLTEVAEDLHREGPMAWPEAEVIPVGRHNIDG